MSHETIQQKAEQAVNRILAGFEYTVDGDETLEEIIALAREDWDSDEGWRQARGRSSYARPPDDKLAVDFLRHQRTAYDYQLAQIQSTCEELLMDLWQREIVTDGDEEEPYRRSFDDVQNNAHQIVRAKTLGAIEAKHPALAGAVAQRRDSNYVVSDGQTFRVGPPPFPYRR